MLGKRNVIRYNSVGLFVTENKGENKLLKFFNRVQSVSLSVDIQRQDVQHIGSDNFLVRKIVSAPTISLKMEYLLTDGYEEDCLGLNINRPDFPFEGGTIHKNLKDNKSLFLAIGQEQFDLIKYSEKETKFSGIDIIGIGNCFITDFSISSSVGSLSTASVTMVASDLTYECEGSHFWSGIIEELSALLRQRSPASAGTETTSDESDEGDDFITFQDETKIFLQNTYQTGELKGVRDPSLNLPNRGSLNDIDGVVFDPKMYNSVVSAIPPGGINFKVSNINVGGPVINGTDQGQCLTGDANIQSFDLSIPFAREDLKGFQSMHVYGRKMRYPQLGTISLSLLTSAFKGGRLSEIFCQDKFYQIELEFNNQCNFSCNNAPKNSLMKIIITNAKLGGYSMNKSIGSISTIDCNFSFGISMSQGVYIFGSKPETRMNSFVRNAEGKYEPNFHGFNKCTPAGSDAPSGLGINKILEQEDSPSSLSIHDYQGAKVLEGSDAPSNITISRYLEQSDAPNNIEISEQ